jgi:hypothetical protein
LVGEEARCGADILFLEHDQRLSDGCREVSVGAVCDHDDMVLAPTVLPQ